MIELKQENVDLKTLNSSFSLFRFIPDNFIDNAHTDTTIHVTRDGDIYEKFDILHPLENEFYYLVFDSLSRVIKYGYSGCGVCSHTPYYWDISYNKYMKVCKMTMVMFGKEGGNINIDYNNMGYIVLFEQYNIEKELFNKISIK